MHETKAKFFLTQVTCAGLCGGVVTGVLLCGVVLNTSVWVALARPVEVAHVTVRGTGCVDSCVSDFL